MRGASGERANGRGEASPGPGRRSRPRLADQARPGHRGVGADRQQRLAAASLAARVADTGTGATAGLGIFPSGAGDQLLRLCVEHDPRRGLHTVFNAASGHVCPGSVSEVTTMRVVSPWAPDDGREGRMVWLYTVMTLSSWVRVAGTCCRPRSSPAGVSPWAKATGSAAPASTGGASRVRGGDGGRPAAGGPPPSASPRPSRPREPPGPAG